MKASFVIPPLSGNVLLASALCIGLTVAERPASAACNIIGGQAYGDCTGVTINRQEPQDSVVSGYKSVQGIARNITVEQGGSLHLSGIASSVTVKQGGSASISGIINGTLSVSGEANIEGQVDYLFLDGGRVKVSGILVAYGGKGVLHLNAGAYVAGTIIDKTTERIIGE